MKLIDAKGLTQADPYIFEHGGKYYIYSTGIDGVHCYESDALFGEWRHVGSVLTVAGQKEFWAPAVIEHDGAFYMYYSSMPEDSYDVHLQRIKVAVSKTPTGKFEFVKDVLPPFSIDAHPVRNADGLYLFYSINRYEGRRVGTYIVCDKMIDIFTPSGAPSAVVVPTLDEEIFEHDRFKKGEHWHTIEGACYFRIGDWHYCMYSGNCYKKDTYHIGYAVCNSKSDRLDKLVFEKHTDNGKYAPLIAANASETSTGHNTVIECDGQLYVIYHGRAYSDNVEDEPRTAHACKLFADGKLLRAERI